MFTVRANGTQYSMAFEQRTVKRLAQGHFEDVVETVCRIYQKDLTEISSGVAQRSPSDEEDTPKALELAMKRALEGVWFSAIDFREQKAFRAAFWQALRAAIWNEWRPEVTESSGDVFLDLGFSPKEAEQLNADANARICGESPLPPPELIVDAIPVESEEVKLLRATLTALAEDHNEANPVTQCRTCSGLRNELNQALARA